MADGGQHTTAPNVLIADNEINTLQVQIVHMNPTTTTLLHSDSPPSAKKAKRETTLTSEAVEILNKSIKDENKRKFDFGEDLNALADEEVECPALRDWKAYYSRKSTEDIPTASAEAHATTGREVEIGNLFPNEETLTDGEKTRFVVAVGGPGSGKSTFVRDYGSKVLEKKIEDMKSILIVYFVDARKLTKEPETKLSFWEFLFSKLVHGFDKISDEVIEWMREEENQERILIIIDGLNELNKFPMDKSCKAIDYEDAETPAVIFYNLLSKRLLPKAKILAASRSYGIQDYHKDVRPQQIIKLVGFSKENTENVFRKLVRPVVGKRWERFSDVLKSLCSYPLYLVYVAFMLSSDPDEEIDDVPSILMRLIQNLLKRNDLEKDSERFKALKSICLDKLKEGQTSFPSSDLAKYGLEEEHILKLCIGAPARTERGMWESSSGERYIFFSHVLIQESLACLALLDLDPPEYEKDVEDHISDFPFSTIKQLACGILFNSKPQFEKLADIRYKEEKKGILLKKIGQSLTAGLSPNQMLHHLACINEIGQPTPSESNILPNAIDLSGQIPTAYTTSIMAPAIAKCKFLSELVLYRCALDGDKIKILWKSLRDSELKINLLNLGCNPDIGPTCLKAVAKTTCHCQVHHLDLHACGLTVSHMTTFSNELRRNGSKKIKLESLSLSSNPEMKKEGLEAAALAVEVGKLKKLDVGRCDVSADKLRAVNKYNLRSLQELVLTKNLLQSSSGEADKTRMSAVGECVVKNEISELHINWCDLERRDLECLERSLDGLRLPLKALNVSNNHINTDACHEVLCRIAKNFGTKRMDVHKCGFSKAQMDDLKVEEFSRMDTYLSVELSTDEFRKLMDRNKGRFLEVSLRNTRKNLGELPHQLKKYETRFRKLCLPEGRKASPRDINILLELLPYISEELSLGEWHINRVGRRRLQEGLNECKGCPNLSIWFSATEILQAKKS